MNASSQLLGAIELPYCWAGTEGTVRVVMRINEDPVALGCWEVARGFPYIRATVEPPARGYADATGWIQLVDYDGRGFEVDPFEPLGKTNHPFDLFGYAPTFFDAPFTDERPNWDFLAHTFLCGIGGKLGDEQRDVRAVLGFSWGFAKRGQEFDYFAPAPLAPADWDGHLDFLAETYPNWRFLSGFRQHPQEP